MMNQRCTYRLVPLVLALVGLLLLVKRPATAAPSTPDTPPSAPNWTTPTLVSLAGLSSADAKVSAAPDGQTVMVAFNQQISGSSVNNDPYYVLSTDNGATWTPLPTAIHNSPVTAANSLFVDIAYDGSGAAHAVWREGLGLAYSNNSLYTWPTNNTNNPPLTLSAPTAPGASDPLIVTTGTVVDIIWSEGTNSGNPNIRHARSADGGATFPINQVINSTSTNDSRVPALAVDPHDVNRIYAVWEQQLMDGSTNTVYFAQGTVTGGAIVWTTPIQISPGNDRQPEIVANAQGLHIVYTHKEPTLGDQQLVYYIRCNSSNCTQVSNWSSPVNASGQFVSVNSSDPYDIVSSMVDYNGCRYVYYHGTDITLVQDTERIWGVNSCDGWQAGGNERLTDPANVRAINPDVATGPGGWIYLVYVRADTLNRQIYVMRAQEDPTFRALLPVIHRR